MMRPATSAVIARAAIAAVGIVLAGGLSSCGRFLVANSESQEEWEEVFDFEVRPGTMNPAEAEQAVNSQVGPGRIVTGSATHRGSVAAPGGSVDFFTYRVLDQELSSQSAFCTATIAESAMSAGCGVDRPSMVTKPIQVNGESWGGVWRSADFVVQADVVRVEATAVDGTNYTVTPLDGFGYIEWPDERGSLELVAFDGEDQEVGRAFAGLDR